MVYELKAGGVDERRLVGAKLEKLAEGETGLTPFKIVTVYIELFNYTLHLFLLEILEA